MHVLIINKPSFYPTIPCCLYLFDFQIKSPYIAQGRLDSSTFGCLGLNTIEMCLCKHTYVQNYKDNTKIMLWNIWEQFNRTMLCITKLNFFFFETKSHWTQSGLRLWGWPEIIGVHHCSHFCVELRSKPMAVGHSRQRLYRLSHSPSFLKTFKNKGVYINNCSSGPENKSLNANTSCYLTTDLKWNVTTCLLMSQQKIFHLYFKERRWVTHPTIS